MRNVIVIFVILSGLNLSNSLRAKDTQNRDTIKQNFLNPPPDCWPHTRWWWPGNPMTKEEITWELEQMRNVGIRGVEQITMSPVYEKGNIEYLSDEFMEMVKHTVAEAKRLGMEVSFNFGGPSWIIGGEWVPDEDRAKDLIPTSVDLLGPQEFHGPLPDKLMKTNRSWEHYEPYLSGDETLLAVVAGNVVDGRIDKRTLVVLTELVENRSLEWQIPEGHWRLMAFWLARNHHSIAVDHFNKGAMERYCEYIGGRFEQAVGHEFGKTLDSFFCDSFELPNLASGIYWSTGLLEQFEDFNGYDLVPFLPAIWWEVSDISPKVRYDVNHFLHHVGMEAFFATFLNWCDRNGVRGRIQAYGFPTDNIEAAGATHIPEMEITPGEKDCAPWFDTRIGPKKYVASGAHLYGRPVVSVEAYTFMHWERYRATLEELKIASDGFLRSGATKFYNHGYCYLPERDLAPTRRTPWAVQLNPSNVWWRYYPLLAEYIARCSWLLRQGDFAPDIAVYSPLANQWTLDVLNPRKWTREFEWGELGFLLISNGYDFDLLNDDALQHLASFENGVIHIRNMAYQVLLLPNVDALPLKTMQSIQRYVHSGGVVIAFDRVPRFSTGMVDYQNNDAQVRKIAGEMFVEPHGRDAAGHVSYGNGHTYWLKHVIDRRIWWDQRSAALDPFQKTIARHVLPDFNIDFAREGLRKNEGLTFLHRKVHDADVYFVANIQDQPSTVPVTFRVKNKGLWEWNPFTGAITRRYQFAENETGTIVPLHLTPYGSTILVFDGAPYPHVTQSNLDAITAVGDSGVHALAATNGVFHLTIDRNRQTIRKKVTVTDVPAPFYLTGDWKLTLTARDFPRLERHMFDLSSWTDDPDTRHFSGTGCYELRFFLPEHYVRDDLLLSLSVGKVGNIAEVEINGVPVGTIWLRGQTLDVTDAVRSGPNVLVIRVTNTGINRVAGWDEPPPVPAEIAALYGRDITHWRPPELDFEPLPASGLLGPVKITVLKNVKVDL